MDVQDQFQRIVYGTKIDIWKSLFTAIDISKKRALALDSLDRKKLFAPTGVDENHNPERSRENLPVSLPVPSIEALSELLDYVINNYTELTPNKKIQIVSEIEFEARVSSLSEKLSEAQHAVFDSSLKCKELIETVTKLEERLATNSDSLGALRIKQTDTENALYSAKEKILTLEAERRETLNLHVQSAQLGSLDHDHAQSLAARNKIMRNELDLLRTEHAKLKSSFDKTTFQSERLKQKLLITTSQSDFLQSELDKVVSENHNSFQEKSSQIRQLVQQLEIAKQEKIAIESSFSTCSEQLKNCQKDLWDNKKLVIELEAKIKDSEAQFKIEIESLKKVAQNNKNLFSDASEYIQKLSDELVDARNETAKSISEYEEKLAQSIQSGEDARLETLAAKNKIIELEEAIISIQKIQSDYEISKGSSSISQIFPVATLEVNAKNSGMAYSELWCQLAKEKKRNLFLESRVEELDFGLSKVLEEMEERGPAVLEIAKENSELMASRIEISSENANLKRRISDMLRDANEFENKLKETKSALDNSNKKSKRLAKQLVHLLAGMNADHVIQYLSTYFINTQSSSNSCKSSSKDNSSNISQNDEINRNQNYTLENDENLSVDSGVFSDLEELVAKNQTLEDEVESLRSLVDSQCEKLKQNEKQSCNDNELEVMNLELKRLQQRLDETLVELENKSNNQSNESNNKNTSHDKILQMSIKIEHFQTILPVLEEKRAELEEKCLERAQEITKVNSKLLVLENEKMDAIKSLASVKIQLGNSEGRCSAYLTSIHQWESRLEEKSKEIKCLHSELEATKRLLVLAKSDCEILENAQNVGLETVSQLKADCDTYKRLLNEAKEEHSEQYSYIKSELGRALNERDDAKAEIVSLSNRYFEAVEDGKESLLKISRHLRENFPKLLKTDTETNEEKNQLENNSNQKNNDALIFNQENKMVSSIDEKRDTDIEQKLKQQIYELQCDIIYLQNQLKQQDELQNEILQRNKSLECDLSNIIAQNDDEKQNFSQFLKEKETIEEKHALSLAKIVEIENEKIMMENELSVFKSNLEKLNEEHSLCIGRISNYQKDIDDERQLYNIAISKHSKDLEILECSRLEVNNLRNQLLESIHKAECAETIWQEKVSLCEGKVSEAKERLRQAENQIEILRAQNLELFSAAQEDEERERTENELQSSIDDQSNDNDSNKNKGRKSAIVQEKLLKLLRAERSAIEIEKQSAYFEHARVTAGLERKIAQLTEEVSLYQKKISEESESNVLRATLEEKLTELSIIRESNATLRRDREHADNQISELRAELDSLQESVEKMKHNQAEGSAALSFMTVQMEHYKKEAEDWRIKYTTMLQKFDRIDPEKHKQVVNDVARERIEFESQKERLRDELVRLTGIANDRVRNAVAQKKALTAEVSSLREKQSQSILNLKECEGKLLAAQDMALSSNTELVNLKNELDRKKSEVGLLKTQMLHQRMAQPYMNKKPIIVTEKVIIESEVTTSSSSSSSKLNLEAKDLINNNNTEVDQVNIISIVKKLPHEETNIYNKEIESTSINMEIGKESNLIPQLSAKTDNISSQETITENGPIVICNPNKVDIEDLSSSSLLLLPPSSSIKEQLIKKNENVLDLSTSILQKAITENTDNNNNGNLIKIDESSLVNKTEETDIADNDEKTNEIPPSPPPLKIMPTKRSMTQSDEDDNNNTLSTKRQRLEINQTEQNILYPEQLKIQTESINDDLKGKQQSNRFSRTVLLKKALECTGVLTGIKKELENSLIKKQQQQQKNEKKNILDDQKRIVSEEKEEEEEGLVVEEKNILGLLNEEKDKLLLILEGKEANSSNISIQLPLPTQTSSEIITTTTRSSPLEAGEIDEKELTSSIIIINQNNGGESIVKTTENVTSNSESSKNSFSYKPISFPITTLNYNASSTTAAAATVPSSSFKTNSTSSTIISGTIKSVGTTLSLPILSSSEIVATAAAATQQQQQKLGANLQQKVPNNSSSSSIILENEPVHGFKKRFSVGRGSYRGRGIRGTLPTIPGQYSKGK